MVEERNLWWQKSKVGLGREGDVETDSGIVGTNENTVKRC